jgi:hypothetical protein
MTAIPIQVAANRRPGLREWLTDANPIGVFLSKLNIVKLPRKSKDRSRTKSVKVLTYKSRESVARMEFVQYFG